MARVGDDETFSLGHAYQAGFLEVTKKRSVASMWPSSERLGSQVSRHPGSFLSSWLICVTKS